LGNNVTSPPVGEIVSSEAMVHISSHTYHLLLAFHILFFFSQSLYAIFCPTHLAAIFFLRYTQCNAQSNMGFLLDKPHTITFNSPRPRAVTVKRMAAGLSGKGQAVTEVCSSDQDSTIWRCLLA